MQTDSKWPIAARTELSTKLTRFVGTEITQAMNIIRPYVDAPDEGEFEIDFAALPDVALDELAAFANLPKTERRGTTKRPPKKRSSFQPYRSDSTGTASQAMSLVPIAFAPAMESITWDERLARANAMRADASHSRASRYMQIVHPFTVMNPTATVQFFSQQKVEANAMAPLVSWANMYMSDDAVQYVAACDMIAVIEAAPVPVPLLAQNRDSSNSDEEPELDSLSQSGAVVRESPPLGTKSPGKHPRDSDELQAENKRLRERLSRASAQEQQAKDQAAQLQADNEQMRVANEQLTRGLAPDAVARRTLRWVQEVDPMTNRVVWMACREDAERLGGYMTAAAAKGERARSDIACMLRLSQHKASKPGGPKWAQRSPHRAFELGLAVVDMDAVRQHPEMVKDLWAYCFYPGRRAMPNWKPPPARQIVNPPVARRSDKGEKPNAIWRFAWSNAATAPRPDAPAHVTSAAPSGTSGATPLLGLLGNGYLGSSSSAPQLSTAVDRANLAPAQLGDTAAADIDSDDDIPPMQTSAPRPLDIAAASVPPQIGSPAQDPAPVYRRPPPPTREPSRQPSPHAVRPPDEQRRDTLLGLEEPMEAPGTDKCASSVCKCFDVHKHRGGLLTVCEGEHNGTQGCGLAFHWYCERPESQPCGDVWHCLECAKESGWEPKPDCLASARCLACGDPKARTQFVELLPKCTRDCGPQWNLCAKCCYERIDAVYHHDVEAEDDVDVPEGELGPEPLVNIKVSCACCRMPKTHVLGRDGEAHCFLARPPWLSEGDLAARGLQGQLPAPRHRNHWGAALERRVDDAAADDALSVLGSGASDVIDSAADSGALRLSDDGRSILVTTGEAERKERMEQRRIREAQAGRDRQRAAERAEREAAREQQVAEESDPFEFDEDAVMVSSTDVDDTLFAPPAAPPGPQLLTLNGDGSVSSGVPGYVGW